MSDFILSNLMWFWLGAFILFVIIEAATQALTTIWAALAAFLMIFLSKTNMPIRWQLLIFLIVTILLIVFTRPFAIKKLKLGRDKMNVNAIEGQEILITKKITQFEKGEGKAKNGVIWSVTSVDGSEIAENTVCIVEKVNGNTLEVSAK